MIMKRVIKIVFLFLMAFLTIYLIGFLFISLQGKALVNNYVYQSIGKKISFGKMSVVPPFNIKMNDIEIEGLCKIKEVTMYTDITKLIFAEVFFKSVNIVNPVISIVRDRRDNFDIIPPQEQDQQDTQALAGVKASGKPKIKASPRKKRAAAKFMPRVFFENIIVSGGELNFIDKSLDRDGFPIKINNINLVLSDFYLPALKTKFSLLTNILGRPGYPAGVLSAEGFVDFASKNLDLTVGVADVDGVYFAGYAKRFVQSDLKSANVNLIFYADAKNNILNGKGKLVVKDLEFNKEEGQTQEGGTPAISGPIGGIVLDALISPDKRFELDLEIYETQLDNPKFRLKRFAGSIAKPMIEQLLSKPEETIKKFKDIGEKFKGLGKQLEGIFKGKVEEEVQVPEAQPQTPQPQVEPVPVLPVQPTQLAPVLPQPAPSEEPVPAQPAAVQPSEPAPAPPEPAATQPVPAQPTEPAQPLDSTQPVSPGP